MLEVAKTELMPICMEYSRAIAIAIECVGVGHNVIIEKKRAFSLMAADGLTRFSRKSRYGSC